MFLCAFSWPFPFLLRSRVRIKNRSLVSERAGRYPPAKSSQRRRSFSISDTRGGKWPTSSEQARMCCAKLSPTGGCPCWRRCRSAPRAMRRRQRQWERLAKVAPGLREDGFQLANRINRRSNVCLAHFLRGFHSPEPTGTAQSRSTRTPANKKFAGVFKKWSQRSESN